MRWGLLLLVVAYVISGFYGVAEARQRRVIETEETVILNAEDQSAQEVVLNSKEDYYLKTWVRAAALAEEVEDFDLAMKYYNDIKAYFPETQEAEVAGKRLEKLVRKK